ncbi:hypothetical protein [Caldimonas brevitalea]|uniref:hypothetical protein n=1 Tax=Caldimonas brevitalea TaxID=413882 RepID=UPI0012F73D2C|nr:hypothetical protein [Caldimonas brevitalea]
MVATYCDFWEQREYGNAFAGDRPEFRGKIREWLLNADHRQRFAAKLLSPEFQALAERQPSIARTAFCSMADTVFDQLMQ